MSKARIKPIVLILPWLGASERAVQKYVQLYKDVGCDVLVKEVTVMDFLWPQSGMESSRRFLLSFEELISSRDQPIVIHSFSIGCYYYTLMTLHLKAELQMFKTFRKNLKAVVFDSPVAGAVHEMAFGVSRSLTSNKVLRTALKSSILVYFYLTRPYTVKFYTEAMNAFEYQPLIVPTVLFSSTKDYMAVPEAVDSILRTWDKMGFDVRSKVWNDAGHVQNFIHHPSVYKEIIFKLLHDYLSDNILFSSKI